MNYVEAPNDNYDNSPSLFLAGGITGCPDWQATVVKMLQNEDVTLFSPRRKDFDVTNQKESEIQIAWEHKYLSQADAVSFWFCEKEIQPITLLEFGRWSTKELNKKLFVGVDPKYPRIKDVQTQLSLERPEIQIVYSLSDLVAQIQIWLQTNRKVG